jgi:hypothetical protein
METTRPTVSDDVYDIRTGNPHLNGIINRLNDFLQGYKLVQVVSDTAEPAHGHDSRYTHLGGDHVVDIRPFAGQLQLCIPVGLWIQLPLAGVTHGGQQHWATVEFSGHFLRLNKPYIFGTDPGQLAYQCYTFWRLRPIGDESGK